MAIWFKPNLSIEQIQPLGNNTLVAHLGIEITEVGENYFIIESEGTKLKVDKSAISMEASQVLNAPPKEAKK